MNASINAPSTRHFALATACHWREETRARCHYLPLYLGCLPTGNSPLIRFNCADKGLQVHSLLYKSQMAGNGNCTPARSFVHLCTCWRVTDRRLAPSRSIICKLTSRSLRGKGPLSGLHSTESEEGNSANWLENWPANSLAHRTSNEQLPVECSARFPSFPCLGCIPGAPPLSMKVHLMGK